MSNNNPIGLFDSGIGGTSIWKEIHDLLPNENTIYLADSKNAPYGQKSKEEIIQLSIKNTEYLLNKNCKIIVVACNTATTNAIKVLRANYDVPFIGIEPAIKPAAINSKKNIIGILATQGTLNSELFHQTAEKFQDTKIIEQIGHGLVSLIEKGEINSKTSSKKMSLDLEKIKSFSN
jgi:glutamate racemase